MEGDVIQFRQYEPLSRVGHGQSLPLLCAGGDGHGGRFRIQQGGDALYGAFPQQPHFRGGFAELGGLSLAAAHPHGV